MTIKEVSEKYGVSQDTLRYYERIGLIPPVARTAGGIRDYQPSDIGWVETAVCMRGAGVPIEDLIEYVKLFQMGDATFDQIAQDVCINNSPITMVTFLGSVYGMNDVTHLGLQDIPMMANIPNLVYLAPTTKEEYLAMLDWCMDQTDHPVAIMLPGGAMISDGAKVTKEQIVDDVLNL